MEEGFFCYNISNYSNIITKKTYLCTLKFNQIKDEINCY